MLPTPGMGHLIPLAELGKRLVHRHGLSVTFITYAESASKAQRALLDSLLPSITSVELPPFDLSDLRPDAKIETRMSVASARSVPAVANVLRGLKESHLLVAFVADLFGADTFDAARDVGVPAYLFFPSNFLALSVFLRLPELDREFPCEFRDLPTPVKLPGCVPIPGRDILAPLQDRKDDAYSWIVHHGNKYREAAGILVNTFDEIEPEAAKVLKRPEPGIRTPVWSVGPLILSGWGQDRATDDGSGCLAWLDEQPRSSVLFVSFGSGGTLSTEQTRELAHGLELSGQRFLWVVRSPSDHESSANYYNAESIEDPFEFLPPGFMERTRDVGLVVSSWAPQIEVLGHESTGGFLMHCGWNSTLESIAKGVPMIAWPLFAEQRQNAIMLTEDAGVALRPKFDEEDGIARREAISEVVKELMEGTKGKAVRRRVRELQEAGARALDEEKGTSSMALKEIVKKWMEV